MIKSPQTIENILLKGASVIIPSKHFSTTNLRMFAKAAQRGNSKLHIIANPELSDYDIEQIVAEAPKNIIIDLRDLTL